MQACHGLPASGGYLAFEATLDRVRNPVIGGPQCKETYNLIALVVTAANVGKLPTADHRYQQVMDQ